MAERDMVTLVARQPELDLSPLPTLGYHYTNEQHHTTVHLPENSRPKYSQADADESLICNVGFPYIRSSDGQYHIRGRLNDPIHFRAPQR